MPAPGEQGPEPTNWELMRRLDKVDESIGKLGTDFLSTAVYSADKRGNDDRHTRAESRLTELEKNAQDADKLKRSQRLTITLAFAVPIVTFVGNYFINHP
jgi:hypothetical protein